MTTYYHPAVSQKLIWIDQAIHAGSAKYNIGGYAFLEGQLRYDLFNKTLNDIIQSQEVYRTVFKEEQYELVCLVHERANDYQIDLIDCSAETNPEAYAISYMEKDFGTSFEVENNYLFRFLLFRINDSRHLWYAKVHHLISDGMSFKLLLNQASALYGAYTRSGESTVITYNYSEYAAEDSEYYQSQHMNDDRSFWLNEFKQLPPEVLVQKKAVDTKGPVAGSETLYLSPELKNIVQAAATRHKVSVFNIILGLLLIYFSRTRQQPVIPFGVPVLNRTKKKYRSTAGVFMNLLAIPFQVQDTDTFDDVIRRIKEKMSACLRHQRYQYGNLVGELQTATDKPLYDIRISYEDFEFTADFGGLQTGATALSNHHEIDKLAIYLREYHNQGFDVRFVYNTVYFDKAAIRSVKDSLYKMILALPSCDGLPVMQTELLDEQERACIIRLSQGPVKPRYHQTFLTSWHAAVLNWPQHICVSGNAGMYTYCEMDQLAVRLAHALGRRQSGPNNRIALLLPRSGKMIIGMLGSMMAGLTYIPLDEEYPVARIAHILEDAGSVLLLTSEEIASQHPYPNAVQVVIIEELLQEEPGVVVQQAVPVDGHQPCYIIYTSGSTGTPKGVSISHRSLADYVCTFTEHFQVTSNDTVVQLASIGFDTSVEEIYPVLAAGGRLHIHEDRKDIFTLGAVIQQEAVTIVSTNPMVVQFLNTCSLPASLRIVISGGDVLRKEYVDQLLATGVQVYNTYGPTESTVCASYYQLKQADVTMYIGQPIANREIYILDAGRHIQPLGVEGEIYIGGSGLALEYVNNDALTSDKFVTHILDDNKKLYRTGDIGILMPDGNVVFKGRTDDQLKFRGYRIEAGEVERIIIEKGQVENCVVCIREINAIPVLVAYVQGNDQSAHFAASLKNTVSNWLPPFMVPEIIVPLSHFPLLVSGKINKPELPPIGRQHLVRTGNAQSVAPRTFIERKLFEIWSAVLQTDQFGINDSFFDLGGHSLSAMQLLNHYYKHFSVRLTIKELFEHACISEQAFLLTERTTEQYLVIPAMPVAPDYAVSDGQRRLWILSQLETEARAYHLYGQLPLEGEYQKAFFERALQQVIARHDILRTVFHMNESGELRQVILSDNEYQPDINFPDYEGMETDAVEAYIASESFRAFNLQHGPLWRVALIKTHSGRYLFYYNMHHIISDGWSMELLCREVMDNYACMVKGDSPQQKTLPIQYKDYAAWQQEQLSGSRMQAHRAYWLEQLAGELPVFSFPAFKPRPAVQSHNGNVLLATIGYDTMQALRALCRSQQATLFMGLLAVTKAVLYRYTGQEDIIAGSPVAGRDHADLEDQIGFYVNTLALRTRFSGTDNFSDLLNQVRDVTIAGYSHQAYPFDRLVEDLNIPKDMSRSAVFDVMVILHNQHNRQTIWGKAHNKTGNAIVEGGNCAVPFDLTLEFIEGSDGLYMAVQFNSDVYDKESISRFIEHFRRLIQLVVADPQKAICDHALPTAAEREQLLYEFNDTVNDFGKAQTLIELCTNQAGKSPDDIALLYENKAVSYRQMNECANQLGRFLQKHYNIKPDDVVGIQLPRSEWMVIALLAVLKAGGAYVPLDIIYPAERIAYIIQDSKAKVVIDETILERFKNMADDYAKDNITGKSQPSHLAYVIYTSGSTGVPKGVMIENRNVTAFINWCKQEFGTGNDLVVFGVTSICFDLSVFEIFYSLCTGKTLRILPDALAVPDYLHTADNILLNTVPGVVGALLHNKTNLATVKVLNMAGEPVPVKYIESLDCRRMAVRNLYGPTETTTYSSMYRFSGNDALVIGRPIANTQLYILNDHQQLQPIGITGEIYIGGAGVARGYLNKETLTAAQFIVHPFRPNERVYRTGDLGRWLPDGNIELLGRKDDQVKIRGYRIETTEIEQALLRHPHIQEALVMVLPTVEEEKDLVAYVAGDHTLNVSDIRDFIGEKLPGFMVPASYVQLQALPRLPNGKVDKNKLPHTAGTNMGTGVEYLAPRNTTEEKIVQLWQELLGKTPVSVKDNFFALGGHSIKAIRLANQLSKAFDSRVTLKEMFLHTTPEEQAKWIGQSAKNTYDKLSLAPVRASFELSSSQRRLWTLSQFNEGNAAYNIPGYYRLEGKLNDAALESAFRSLIRRHEILRTVFKEDENKEIRQFVLLSEAAGFTIAKYDYRKEIDPEGKVRQEIQEAFVAPFDLATPPLLRACIYQVADHTWIFTYVMHHIISDGWSVNIIMKELFALYESYSGGRMTELPVLQMQYKDYAYWQQQQVRDTTIKNHKAYWLQQFEGTLPALRLWTDKPRPAVRTFKGGLVKKQFPAAILHGLKAIGRQQNASLFMGLLAAVNSLLYRYTSQEDIIIGTPVAGREHEDLELQAGLYVQVLALRTKFSGAGSFNELLNKVKKDFLQACEHQVYPFDELINELKLEPGLSRNALFDVMVVLQNTGRAGTSPVQLGDVSICECPWAEQTISKFDLTFIFEEQGETLQAGIEYNSDIFREETIERLGNHLEILLESIIQQPATPLRQLKYLSTIEEHQLLVSFNDSAIAYQPHDTIITLFERQAAKVQDQKAVVCEGNCLSYRQLNEMANRLGDYLRKQYAIQPDELIGIQLPRSEWVVITILGILKSGAAFVPIDPDYPQERTDYMLTDSQCKVLIDEQELAKFRHEAMRYSSENDRSVTLPSHLAYVIYTSGSTGLPKGVMIEHKGVVNLVRSQVAALGLREGTGTLQFSSFSFDASCYEMFNTLLSGGFLGMPSRETILSAPMLSDFINKHQLSVAVLPPSFLKGIQEITAQIKTIVSAGEALEVDTARMIISRGVHLINAYGPTESTVCASLSHHPILDDSRTTIGKPIANTTLYILDENKCLLPVGVAGELFIGGVQLARGYLNRADMTAYRFIDHPFQPGERLYRTGDMARWLPDGNIEFLGRIDEQVKIRGYRIELNEIERALQAHPLIESAAVAVKTGNAGDKELVAYLVSATSIKSSDIRSYLLTRLPAYMLPVIYVQLQELPLTPNGKTDKKNLPDPGNQRRETGVEYTGPRNATEEKLVIMWQDILGLKKIGVKDNFFELGGHSLKTAQLIARINNTFFIRIGIQNIFQEPTIESIAEQIAFILDQERQRQNKERLVQINM